MRRKRERSVVGKSGAAREVETWTIGAMVRRIWVSFWDKPGLLRSLRRRWARVWW